jgi:hypothetical protein
MLHNGQEFGDDYWLPHSGDGRVLPRPLHWDAYSDDFVGQRLYGIYQQLIVIRKAHPALRSPNYFPAANHPDGYGVIHDQVVVFHRYGHDADGRFERFIIVINFGDWDQVVTLPFPANGEWRDLLNDEVTIIPHFRLYNQRIPSNWGRIYYQRSE